MPPDRQAEIEALYHAALSQPREARAAFLDQACGDNEPLRREVESLLAHAVSGDGFLEQPAFASTPPLAPGQMLGPYILGEQIGEGGMGDVYRARDSNLQRDVAVKVLRPEVAGDPDRLARFVREARLLASLNHPHIAQVHGLEEAAGKQALVMELVEGPTLADRIAHGPLPVEEALQVARQIAEALEAAHEQGIIHRDLKPANVKLRRDGRVKVLDFGLAKALDQLGDRVDEQANISAVGVTAPGTILGTIAYMSPEQAAGKPVDRRADVWAFGCVLYEMLTGQRAFAGKGTAETIAAVLTKEPDWGALPQALPVTVRMFLRRALEKDPLRRVRDSGDLRLALDGAFDPATGADSGVAADSRQRARRASPWIAAVLLAGLSIGLVVRTINTDRDSRTLSFYIDPPEGSGFGGPTMAPQPALSADGRHLAFVAPVGSRLAVWVQTVGEVRARPLRGTEGAGFPFWSPDGDFVGFGQKGSLKKIATYGDAAPQELCSCEATSGGSWGRDGTVVFAGPDGVFRVAAKGGAPERVTALDASRGEFAHRYPVLLPDGRRFLYLVRSDQEQHRGLFLGSLDAPSFKKRLVADDSNGAFGTDRKGRTYLFFVRDLTLLAQPFDAVSGDLSGEPVVVARPVIPGQTGRLAPFSVNGPTLVYRHSMGARSELLWVDRRGASDGDIGAPQGEYLEPALSPDGTRVAVSRYDPTTGKSDVWTVDRRRGVTEQITRDPVGASLPLWSSDHAIVFASARAGPWDIYERSADGSGIDRDVFVASRPVQKYPSDITRDGRFLVFHDGTYVWTVDLGGNKSPVRLVQGRYGRVSRNQRWLAYTFEGEVYVTAFPQPRERRRISAAGGTDPQWRQDGRELYYIDADSMLNAVTVRTDPSFEYATPVRLFRITSGPFPESRYAVNADGQRFIVINDLRRNEPRLAVTINWTLEGAKPRPGP